MRTSRAVTVGDLFCGAGLFSEAFQSCGANISFAVEIDPFAAKSYAQNVGSHVQVESVERLSKNERVDVIVAGPPCQGFSTLGRRDPLDARNRLCMIIPKWAKKCKAQVVVVENVPPFVESGSWKELCNELLDQGYELTTWRLDAADFGVPQFRRRSFTIASKVGLPSPPHHATADRITSAQAFRKTRRGDSMHVWPVPSALAAARIRLVPECGDKRDILLKSPKLCPPSWRRVGCNATDVWGRMSLARPSNTLRCDFQNPSKGRYLHPFEHRVISLREGARLQGIPEEWEMYGHRTAITRQIGNGVPLGLGKAVAAKILSLFD